MHSAAQPNPPLAARVMRHLRVAVQFARIGALRKIQYRIEFVNQVVMDTIFYAVHILAFEFLFRYADDLAGWSRSDVRIFLAMLFQSDAFMMVFLGQCWLFGEDLKNGNLDTVRVRPGSPIFLYFFQRFSLEAVVNFVLATGYLVYAIDSADLWSFALLWTLPWALLLAYGTRILLVVLYSIAELFVTNSNASHLFHNFFSEVSDRPIDMLGKRMRALLLYVVPAGGLAYYPAVLLLNRESLLSALAHTAYFLAFGALVFRGWRASLRRYDSAMS